MTNLKLNSKRLLSQQPAVAFVVVARVSIHRVKPVSVLDRSGWFPEI